MEIGASIFSSPITRWRRPTSPLRSSNAALTRSGWQSIRTCRSPAGSRIPLARRRLRKSIGAGNTFATDLFSYEAGSRSASRDRRQGLGILRAFRHSMAHRHAQGQISPISGGSREADRSGIYRGPWRSRTAELCAARTSVSCRQGYSAPRHLAVLASDIGGRNSAREARRAVSNGRPRSSYARPR